MSRGTPISSAADEKRPSGNMLSFAPSPIFNPSWAHRPAVSSPLSSSPIRATSPLSPIDSNTLPQRFSQSSPIQPLKFKYASRAPRPNPVIRKREEVQEKRRSAFLQNVRQKSDDKAWARRDVEGQVRIHHSPISSHFFMTNWIADISCRSLSSHHS
jgi:hypothetical protein